MYGCKREKNRKTIGLYTFYNLLKGDDLSCVEKSVVPKVADLTKY